MLAQVDPKQQTEATSSATAAKDSSGLILDRCSQKQAFETYYAWARQEHWNPGAKGQEISEVFHKADPQGFFYGKVPKQPNASTGTGQKQEEIVSIVSAVRYGDEQAWIGYYIVSPHHRGKGYGHESFRKALEHVGHNRPSIGLDSVLDQVENYKKSGFTEVAWENERRHGSVKDLVEAQELELVEKIARGEMPELVHLSDEKVDWEQLPGIEQHYTGLKRPQFVKDWVNFHAHHPEQHRFGAAVLQTEEEEEVEAEGGHLDDVDSTTKVAKKESDKKPVVLGYACVRPAESSYRLGPLYASTPEVAKQLLVKLATEVVLAEKQTPHHTPLFFDVDMPNSNPEAVKLFDSLGWKDTFPSMRLWKGKVPEHDVNGVYAVATLELG